MRRHFLVLVLFAGLGSSFSFAQSSSAKDPFARYLSGVSGGSPEHSLQRFAAECGVDVSMIKPKYAVGPGSAFTQVKNLAVGLRNVDTDFYSTAEVWAAGNRVLIEVWANSDDVGSEVRFFKCFADRELVQAEVITWELPLVKKGGLLGWGYRRRWNRNAKRQIQRTTADFVDEAERPIHKPKLDQESEKGLLCVPSLGSLKELMLPAALLR